MAYDPNLPANNSPIVSAELRSQLTGLKALIDQKPSMDDVNSAIPVVAAANVDGFSQLDVGISDPPTQAELQSVVDALNQLITSLQAHPET